MTLLCPKCQTSKPLDAFGHDTTRANKRRCWCRACESAYAHARYIRNKAAHMAQTNAWRRANPAKVAAATARARRANPAKTRATNRKSWLRIAYGVTPEWWDAKHAEQNGCCAACGVRPEAPRGRARSPLVVDHDHLTGQARELLCYNCNFLLGRLENDALRVNALMSYLKRHAPKTP